MQVSTDKLPSHSKLSPSGCEGGPESALRTPVRGKGDVTRT